MKNEILRLDGQWARAAEAGDLERVLAYGSEDACVVDIWIDLPALQ
jgi:ketosteroid isomerase-like protein